MNDLIVCRQCFQLVFHIHVQSLVLNRAINTEGLITTVMNCLATLLPQIRLWYDDDYDHIFNKCISATFYCFAFRKLQYQQGSGKKKQNYKISRKSVVIIFKKITSTMLFNGILWRMVKIIALTWQVVLHKLPTRLQRLAQNSTGHSAMPLFNNTVLAFPRVEIT